jgi:hypothetical protein
MKILTWTWNKSQSMVNTLLFYLATSLYGLQMQKLKNTKNAFGLQKIRLHCKEKS